MQQYVQTIADTYYTFFEKNEDFIECVNDKIVEIITNIIQEFVNSLNLDEKDRDIEYAITGDKIEQISFDINNYTWSFFMPKSMTPRDLHKCYHIDADLDYIILPSDALENYLASINIYNENNYDTTGLPKIF